MNKNIFFILIFIFLFLSFIAFKDAMPEAKNQEVMNRLKPYMPYKIEKTLSGLKIIDTRTGKSEEPTNKDFFKRLDELEKEWGKKHLSIKNNLLHIKDDKNNTIKVIILKDKKQINFIHNFFKI